MSSAYNPFFMLLILIVLFGTSTEYKASTTLVNAPAQKFLGCHMCFPAISNLGGMDSTVSWSLGYLFETTGLEEFGSILPDSYVNIDGWFNPNDSPLPAIMSLPDGRQFEYWTTCTNYLGWVALVALIVGWRHRRTYAFGGWFILLLSGMLIAMGPYVRLDGSVILFGEHPIHLPASTIDSFSLYSQSRQCILIDTVLSSVLHWLYSPLVACVAGPLFGCLPSL